MTEGQRDRGATGINTEYRVAEGGGERQKPSSSQSHSFLHHCGFIIFILQSILLSNKFRAEEDTGDYWREEEEEKIINQKIIII